MATIQLSIPIFVSSPTKPSFNFRSRPFRSSASRSGSFPIKCSNNGGNATVNTNNNSGLKDLLSGWVVELANKDGRTGLVDSLRKTAQRVVQPETETKKMKQVISQLMTRDAESVLQHETEIKKMKQDLDHYKARSEKKLVQQETEIMEKKQDLSTRAAEIEECQKRLSEALTLVEEAELSLQNIMQVLRSGYVVADCSGSVYI